MILKMTLILNINNEVEDIPFIESRIQLISLYNFNEIQWDIVN